MYGKVVIFLSFIVLLNAQQCPDLNPGGTTAADCELVPDCNFDNGTLTPLATQCSNELADGDCEQLFPCPTPANGGSPSDCDPTANTGTAGDSTTYPYVRAPACTSPNLRNIALQCAKTCALCCQAPEYNSPGCNSTKSSCKDGDCGKVVVSVIVKTN